jgi:FkbM family methyltransferase
MAIGVKKMAKQVLRKTGLFHPLRDLTRAISPATRLHLRRQLEFHRTFIHPGQLCFDVGANYGYKTAIFAQLGAKVVALEPSAACLEGLKWHHGSNPSVTIVPKAVSASAGTVTFFVGDGLNVSSMRDDWYAAEGQPKVGLEVPATTLDELIAQYGRPDFCKVDVEGCEIEVFKGLSQPIPLIYFEYHYHELDLTRACLAELSKVGTLACNASPMEEMKFLYPDWCPPDTLIERLSADPELRSGDVFVKMS